MGYKYSFCDNETYGTDDINAAISRLTTKGVTVYPTDENLIAAMNGITSEITTPGVDFNQYSCLVSIENESIKISPGTAFFDDGMSIVIDSEGEALPLQYNSYVYLFRDTDRNSCYPVASETLPETGYVLLAYIDESGNVTDKREYAVSKLAPNSEVVPTSFTVTVTYHSYTSPSEVLATINAGYSNFRYLVFKKSSHAIAGYVKLIDDEYTDYEKFYDGSYIAFKKQGQTVYISINPHGDFDTIADLEIILF